MMKYKGNNNDSKVELRDQTSSLDSQNQVLDISSSKYSKPKLLDSSINENQSIMSKEERNRNECSNSHNSEFFNKDELVHSDYSEPPQLGENKKYSKNDHNVQPFHHAYHVGEVLGKGGFGVVYEGTRIRDGLQVALKHVLKSKITDYGQVHIFAFYRYIFVKLYVDPKYINMIEYISLRIDKWTFSSVRGLPTSKDVWNLTSDTPA